MQRKINHLLNLISNNDEINTLAYLEQKNITNLPQITKNSLLEMAAKNELSKVVRRLLDSGADKNLLAKLLIEAAIKKDENSVKTLLNAGADPYQHVHYDGVHMNALATNPPRPHQANKFSYFADKKIAQIILEHPFDQSNLSSLEQAEYINSFFVCEAKYLDEKTVKNLREKFGKKVMKEIVNRPYVDPFNGEKNENEGTLLHMMVAKKYWLLITEELLKCGANPFVLDKRNKSPLYYAVDRYIKKLDEESNQILDGILSGEFEEVKLETNFFESYDQHGIYEGIVANDVWLTKRLFEKIGKDNARILLQRWQYISENDKNFGCEDPLQVAIKNRNEGMINLLLEYGAKLLVTISPNELINKHIRDIGNHYLKKYDENPGLLHRNQEIALRLKNYNLETEAYQKWLFLANIYAQLPNHHGELATKLRKLFENAFNLKEIDIKKLAMHEVEKLFTHTVQQFFKIKKVNTEKINEQLLDEQLNPSSTDQHSVDAIISPEIIQQSKHTVELQNASDNLSAIYSEMKKAEVESANESHLYPYLLNGEYMNPPFPSVMKEKNDNICLISFADVDKQNIIEKSQISVQIPTMSLMDLSIDDINKLAEKKDNQQTTELQQEEKQTMLVQKHGLFTESNQPRGTTSAVKSNKKLETKNQLLSKLKSIFTPITEPTLSEKYSKKEQKTKNII